MNVEELLDQLVAVLGAHLRRHFEVAVAAREAELIAKAERLALTLQQDGANGIVDHMRQRIDPILAESRTVYASAPTALPSPALPGPAKNGQAKRRGRPKSPRVEDTLAAITEEANATLNQIDEAAATFPRPAANE